MRAALDAALNMPAEARDAPASDPKLLHEQMRAYADILSAQEMSRVIRRWADLVEGMSLALSQQDGARPGVYEETLVSQARDEPEPKPEPEPTLADRIATLEAKQQGDIDSLAAQVKRLRAFIGEPK